MKYYVLDDKRVIPAADVFAWARCFEDVPSRIVAQTLLGTIRVSTVFLGVNLRLFGDGPPLLFETMAFDSPDDEEHMRRYSTWEEAESGHGEVVSEIRTLLSVPPRSAVEATP